MWQLPILLGMMADPGKLRSSFQFRPIMRMIVGLGLAVLAFYLLAGRTSELAGATGKLANSDWRWVAVAILAEATSFLCYAILQKQLLQTTGVQIGVRPLLAVTVATNAIANSLPGEPAFSSAYRYIQYRRRGASTAGSSWVVVAILVASAIGLTFMLLVGVIIAAVQSTGYQIRVELVIAILVILLAGAILLRRNLLARFADGVLRHLRRITGHPRDEILHRIEDSLEQLRSVKVVWQRMTMIVVWALLTWTFDCLCLASSFRIVNGEILWQGLLLAYGISQIAAVFPIIPGGLGIVEGSLTAVLVTYGSARVPTLAAVLAYRIIAFWLAIPLGWTAFALIAYSWRRSNKRLQSLESGTNENPDQYGVTI